MHITDTTGVLNMTTLRRISLNWLPPLMAVGFLAQASDVLAAAPSGGAQAQARELLLGNSAASHGPIAAGGAGMDLRIPGRGADAAHAARDLILGSPGPQQLPVSAQTLQARVTPFAAFHGARTGRQDAQAQARRLIHGGAA
jgi:hypothetical protein